MVLDAINRERLRTQAFDDSGHLREEVVPDLFNKRGLAAFRAEDSVNGDVRVSVTHDVPPLAGLEGF